MRNPTSLRLSIAITLLLLAVLSAAFSAQNTGYANLTTPTQECTNLFESGNSLGTTATTGSVPGFTGFPTSTFQNAIAAALIGLMISFDVVGIGYVISKLVPSSQIRNWLPREYWELTKSAILVAVIFSAITLISGVGILLSGQATGSATTTSMSGTTSIGSAVSSAENYLCTVNNQADLAIDEISPLMMGIGMIENPSGGGGLSIFYTGIPIFYPNPLSPVFRSGVSFTVFQSLLESINYVYLGQFSSLFIDYIMFLLVPIKLVFSGQVIILPYLVSLALTVLLPAGLILRALPFTRGVGGTLIAYAIGFSVIWPGILIAFNAPVSSYYCQLLSGGSNSFCTTSISADPSTITTAMSAATQSASSFSCADIPGLASASLIDASCSQIGNSGLQTSNGTTTGGPTILQELGYGFASISSLYPALNLFLQYGTYMIVQLFVLFILDLMLFYAITDNIARLLGGTLKLSLGRRLKLV